MRYVSEQFKAIQDEIIRPALSNLTFEVGTDVANVKNALFLNFDNTVAPEVKPKDATNVYNYAVLGDGGTVDDPTRICAPDKSSGAFATPNHSVPYGMTAETAANTACVIGNSTTSFNFKDITSPITFSFVGAHKPTKVEVEYYDDNNGWQLEKIYLAGVGRYLDEVTFEPDNYDTANKYRRIKVYNNEGSGRFQLSWVRADKSVVDGHNAVSFSKGLVSKAEINNNTDLTSQSLPSYEMTVTCLDVNGEYTPDSDYWDNQFKDGSPCYLKAAYRINGVNEFVPMFFGRLSEKPNYEQGKITFKVAVDWRIGWTYNINPRFDDTLSVGDEVSGEQFFAIMFNGKMFDSYDVFNDGDDRAYSVCSYSGEVDSKEARQLVANALGCFMRADFNKVDLLNANFIQYKPFDDYLTRYDQVKYALESKPKVGRISVSRTDNTVSSEYVEATTSTSAEVGSTTHRFSVFTYETPFFATGKWEIVDAQSDNPDAVISLFANPECYKLDNGNYVVDITLTASEAATIQPIVRFYKVDNNEFDETETITDANEGEVYSNSNILVTNSYIANKVKQVAHLVSDISYLYEVDVIQDLRYEVGDIIRLETEKNVYVTCVITGIKYNLPGSNGHITCRKVFSYEDSDNVILDPVGLSVTFGVTEIEVTKASDRASFVGVMHTENDTYIYVANVEEYDKDVSGTVTSETYNATLTDLNGHIWQFAFYSVPSGTSVSTGAPIVNIPEYDVSTGATAAAYGAIALLKTIYSKQGMTAPVDWECEWEEL